MGSLMLKSDLILQSDSIESNSRVKLNPNIYPLSSIYIKKNVCLSVRYAFGDRMSKCNQTFRKLSSHPGEGRHGVGTTEKGQEGGTWVKFHPVWVYCYLDWFFRDLRKSLTICTEFSYFYFFKLCGIAVLRSEDDKKMKTCTPTQNSLYSGIW
jgi:hypothetical protein